MDGEVTPSGCFVVICILFAVIVYSFFSDSRMRTREGETLSRILGNQWTLREGTSRIKELEFANEISIGFGINTKVRPLLELHSGTKKAWVFQAIARRRMRLFFVVIVDHERFGNCRFFRMTSATDRFVGSPKAQGGTLLPKQWRCVSNTDVPVRDREREKLLCKALSKTKRIDSVTFSHAYIAIGSYDQIYEESFKHFIHEAKQILEAIS